MDVNNQDLFFLIVEDITLDEPLRLKRASFLVSEKNKLCGTDQYDYFLALVFECPEGTPFLQIKSQGIKDKTLVDAILRSITQKKIVMSEETVHILRIFSSCNYPGLYIGNVQRIQDVKAERTLPYLLAFYYYAHLISWRLERDQIHLNLEEIKSPTANIVKEIMRQRLRVINLCRYFLTNNRSGNDEIVHVCNERIKEHKLQEKYARYNEILESFEIYFANIQALKQEHGTKAVKLALNILAFTAVPLGFIGAFSGLAPTNDIFSNPGVIFGNITIDLWLGFSFLIPVLLLGTSHLMDKYVSHNIFRKK